MACCRFRLPLQIQPEGCHKYPFVTPQGRTRESPAHTGAIATQDARATPFTCWQTRRLGRSQGQATMWPMAVVMVDEDANDLLEMLAVEDQEPIQTLRANRPHEPFRDAVGLRRAKRRANNLDPSLWKTWSKLSGNF